MARRKKEPPKDDKYFHYYNNNPKDRHVGDCAYRSLALFLGITWEDAAHLAWDYYLDTGKLLEEADMNRVHDDDFMFTFAKMNIEYFLEDKFDCVVVPVSEYSPYNEEYDFYDCVTVKDFIDNYAKEKEVYFVSAGIHFTVVKNKKVWDIANCKDMAPTAVYVKR